MTNEVSFVYFLPDSPSRVVKFYMSEMHKVRGGGIAIGDPDIMAPALPIQQAEKWYEIHTGKKTEHLVKRKHLRTLKLVKELYITCL